MLKIMAIPRLQNSFTLVVILIIFTGFHWWDPVARWIGIGNEAYQSNDMEQAEKAYLEAEKSNPDSGVVQNNLGSVYYNKGDMESAADMFEKAFTNSEKNIQSQVLYNNGCLFLKANKPAEAAELFIQSLKLNPDDQDAKTNLEFALQLMQNMVTPTPPPQQENQDNQDDQQQQTPQPSTTTQSTNTTPQPRQQENSNTPTPNETQLPQPNIQTPEANRETPL